MHLLHSSLLSSATTAYISNLTAIVQPMMHSFTSLLLVSSLALHIIYAHPSCAVGREAELLKRSVDTFIATESPIALADLLCNIGSTGACASGAASGIVVASPDKTNPNCTFTLLRTI
jgi:glucoamylase